MSSRAKKIIVVSVLLGIAAFFGLRHSVRILQDGAQAYLFGYSLVMMDSTRQSMTNSIPVNHIGHKQTFPDHNFRLVVRPNNDTLYSSAWLDLKEEPVVLSVPDMADRYYVMPFMDAWTNVFASVGTRTTGSGSGNYVIAGPEWNGSLPPDTKLIKSPTNMIWMIGRIQTNSEKDIDNVIKLQRQFKMATLSRWQKGETHRAIESGKSDKDKSTKLYQENPSDRVGKMDADRFFDELSRLMSLYPSAPEDAPMLALLAKFKIIPGKPFDIKELNMLRRFLLKKAVALARKKMADLAASDRAGENGWADMRSGIGVYGTNYPVRAFVSLVGLGALAPEEAAYPKASIDGNGQPLSGENNYRIHFKPGMTPPVDAFWSLTVYDEEEFLVDNPIRRYTIGDRDELVYNADGSLDILIQHQKPSEMVTNWLPAPAGVFTATMRLYMPKKTFLDGSWKLPPIERVEQ